MPAAQVNATKKKRQHLGKVLGFACKSPDTRLHPIVPMFRMPLPRNKLVKYQVGTKDNSKEPASRRVRY